MFVWNCVISDRFGCIICAPVTCNDDMRCDAIVSFGRTDNDNDGPLAKGLLAVWSCTNRSKLCFMWGIAVTTGNCVRTSTTTPSVMRIWCHVCFGSIWSDNRSRIIRKKDDIFSDYFRCCLVRIGWLDRSQFVNIWFFKICSMCSLMRLYKVVEELTILNGLLHIFHHSDFSKCSTILNIAISKTLQISFYYVMSS